VGKKQDKGMGRGRAPERGRLGEREMGGLEDGIGKAGKKDDGKMGR